MQSLIQLQNYYLETPVFSFDVETDTSNYHWESGDRGLAYPASITHISFYSGGLEPLVLSATPQEVQYGFEILNKNTLAFEQFQGAKLEWNFTEEEQQFIKQMFERESYTAIAHNLVFDARQIFGKFQLTIPDSASFWDTLAIHVFGAWGTPEEDEEETTEKLRQSFTLFNLTSQWLDIAEREWWASFKGQRGNLTRLILDSKRREKLGISFEEIERYVAIDSIMAYKLYEWQKKEIEENGYSATYDEARKVQTDSMEMLLQAELEYTKLCIEMAATGVRANVDFLKEELVKYTSLWKENLESLGLTLETEHLFRQRTWQQGYILSRLTELPSDSKIIEDNQLKTKTGAWSFNKKALAYYMESYPELIYFRYHADLETKIEQIQNFLRHSEHDGRIHFILSRLTITGRNAGSSPNTQNLQMSQKNRYAEGSPVEIPQGDAGYLIADEGYQLISLDCSNAENWMGAMYGMDDAMALACAAEDFHSVMASTAYFAEQWASADEKERSRLRKIGKTITFGTAYGMGQAKLARSLGITQEQAKIFLDNKDRKFWRIKNAKDRSSAFATQNGFTVLWTGRRVAIRKWNGVYKGYTAWNSLAQGGVGELIVRGMIEVAKYLKSFQHNNRVVTQVHDEIVIQVHPNDYRKLILQVLSILASRIPQLWNSRTTPACRWLFTLDNIENSHKWGYNPYQDYLLPLNEFVNEWGFHEYPQGVTEAPTWINSWGSGEYALARELGHEVGVPEIELPKEFPWNGLRQQITDTLDALSASVTVDGRTFVFPDNLTVLREIYHKQGKGSYSQILKTLDETLEVMKEYEEWRS